MEIAKLALENGTIYTGRAFGARGEVDGEVVFNTSMTGYQEILTDPSYHGQIVAMTYPQIGNYGVTAEDAESRKPWVRGFVVRELSPRVSNHRSGSSLQDYLEAGDSLDQFLHSFSSVSTEQAVAALELAREALVPDAHPA